MPRQHDEKVHSERKGVEVPPGEDFNSIKKLEYLKRVWRVLEEYYKNLSSPEEVDPKVEEELLDRYLTVLGKRPISSKVTPLCRSCESTDLKEINGFNICQGCGTSKPTIGGNRVSRGASERNRAKKSVHD